MTRDDVLPGRLALDARGTDSAVKSGWQHLCDCFNDEDITFNSRKLVDARGIYWGKSQNLSWDYLNKYQCPKILDGDAFKKVYNKMNSTLFNIVNNWVSVREMEKKCWRRILRLTGT